MRSCVYLPVDEAGKGKWISKCPGPWRDGLGPEFLSNGNHFLILQKKAFVAETTDIVDSEPNLNIYFICVSNTFRVLFSIPY